jgi:hypothetical protein
MYVCDSHRVTEPHVFINKPHILLMDVGPREVNTVTKNAPLQQVKYLPYVVVLDKAR